MKKLLPFSVAARVVLASLLVVLTSHPTARGADAAPPAGTAAGTAPAAANPAAPAAKPTPAKAAASPTVTTPAANTGSPDPKAAAPTGAPTPTTAKTAKDASSNAHAASSDVTPINSKSPAVWTPPAHGAKKHGKHHAPHAKAKAAAAKRAATAPAKSAAAKTGATKPAATKPAAVKPNTKVAKPDAKAAKPEPKAAKPDAKQPAPARTTPATLKLPAKALKPAANPKPPSEAFDSVDDETEGGDSLLGPMLLVSVLVVLSAVGLLVHLRRKKAKAMDDRKDATSETAGETTFTSGIESFDADADDSQAKAGTMSGHGNMSPTSSNGPLGLGRTTSAAPVAGQRGGPAATSRAGSRTIIAGAGQPDVAATAPSMPRTGTQAMGAGPSEPCSFERFVELSVAQSCWAEQGADIAASLEAHFGLSLLDWASLNAYWSQSYTGNAKLAKQFEELEPSFKKKYGTAAA